MRWMLMLLLLGSAACGGCDDESGPVGADLGESVDTGRDTTAADDVGVNTPDQGTSDLGTTTDMGTSDVGTADAEDMPDMPVKATGPRDDLTFTTHDVIFEPRVSLFNIVPTAEAFYVATSSAGDPVTFSLGSPDEVVMTAAPLDSFGAIWARYSNALDVQAADQISNYPGGPLMGGTANGDQLVVDDDGSRIMAGAYFGSVSFGGTTWSSNFTNNGALTTSSGAYVVRTTDNTVEAMFRLRTLSSNSNTSIAGLVLHDDGELTIAGPMTNEVIFPDDTTVTGRGFIARTNATGTPLWSMGLPSIAHLTEAGDHVLVRFSYREAFTLGANSYPAPSTGFAAALAAIDADGNVSWIQRIETAPFMAYIREPRVTADGRIIVPLRAVDETLLDVATPPDPAGDAHLWVLNSEGTLVWSAAAPPNSEYQSIALDDSGVIWATAGICDANGSTIQPKWGDPLTISPCPTADGASTWVLLGLDPNDGSIGFAHAILRGSASVDDLEVLSNGGLVVGAHYFDPTIVLPDTPSAFEVDQLGTGVNDLNGLLLLFE